MNVFRGIVGQTIATEVFLYLTLSDFSEDFVGAAYAIVIHNGIVVILVKKVVAAVLRGRLEGLRQVGSVAVVILRRFLQNALVVALLLHSVKQLRVVGALEISD